LKDIFKVCRFGNRPSMADVVSSKLTKTGISRAQMAEQTFLSRKSLVMNLSTQRTKGRTLSV
jgi:lambda repressor-like predicted transcriptional regulator